MPADLVGSPLVEIGINQISSLASSRHPLQREEPICLEGYLEGYMTPLEISHFEWLVICHNSSEVCVGRMPGPLARMIPEKKTSNAGLPVRVRYQLATVIPLELIVHVQMVAVDRFITHV